jgi:YtfJ family uncharacterized protein
MTSAVATSSGEYMLLKFILMVHLLSWSLVSLANNLEIGNRLETVNVTADGQLNYINNQFSYANWNSDDLVGKVHVIQHIAARNNAKDANAALINAINDANLPEDYYQTTTIINVDEAIIGTGFLVRSRIEENKKEYPTMQVVVDDRGEVKKTWQLSNGNSAIVVLDKTGIVRFAKEGQLSKEENEQIIDMLSQLIKE